MSQVIPCALHSKKKVPLTNSTVFLLRCKNSPHKPQHELISSTECFDQTSFWHLGRTLIELWCALLINRPAKLWDSSLWDRRQQIMSLYWSKCLSSFLLLLPNCCRQQRWIVVRILISPGESQVLAGSPVSVMICLYWKTQISPIFHIFYWSQWIGGLECCPEADPQWTGFNWQKKQEYCKCQQLAMMRM